MPLVIAGERSGAGKTTVTLALLAALSREAGGSGNRVQSFKVGPDYIDPMFHTAITGVPCRNLDPVLTSEAYVQECFARHAALANYALVEGVMGLFDGATGDSDYASTAHIARLLDLPILLVIDCSRLSRSVAAIAHGYRSFDPQLQIAGVVLNRVGSDRHLELLKAALAPVDLPILGVLRRHEMIAIPDRHLGLIPTDELPELNQIIKHLSHLGKTCFDWDRLLPLLDTQGRATARTDSWAHIQPLKAKVSIAVARDRAFNFYYADTLDLLRQLGADLIFWSPLQDAALPDGVQGLYFGGGFPEMFAQELSENRSACQAVQEAIRQGMPTYAECGGLMYLCRGVQGFEGQEWPLVGTLPTTAVMGQRLTLGYRQAQALSDSPVLQRGAMVWGHEFHRSHLTQPPESPLFELRGYDASRSFSPEGWGTPSLHASYVHLHWGTRSDIPARFLSHCAAFTS